MAITSAQLQTALGDGNYNVPRVITELPAVSTFQEWYIAGGTLYAGRTRWVRTTAADNAATQAATVVTALLLGNGPT